MDESFCPDCGGNLPEAPGQDRATAPSSGPRRATPAIIFSACFILLLVVAAILMQATLLHAAPAPVAVNASTSPSPSITPALNSPIITITGAPPYTDHTPAMGNSPEIPVINETSLAVRVHERVNMVRQENGLPVLGMDMVLASLARAHSADMAAQGYFGHVNLHDMDATARGATAGYTCYKDRDRYFSYAIAENLFATYRYDTVLVANSREIKFEWLSEEAIAEATVDAWMKSPEHRDNILDEGMGSEGIGVAVAKDDLVFVTEDFC